MTLFKGRRIPVIQGLADWPSILGDLSEPGDYCGPVYGYTGDKPAVFFLLPIPRDEDAPPGARSVHHVTFPPHTYRECDDGSLEIRNSIGAMPYWHGYLDVGHVWRTA